MSCSVKVMKQSYFVRIDILAIDNYVNELVVESAGSCLGCVGHLGLFLNIMS